MPLLEVIQYVTHNRSLVMDVLLWSYGQCAEEDLQNHLPPASRGTDARGKGLPKGAVYGGARGGVGTEQQITGPQQELRAAGAAVEEPLD